MTAALLALLLAQPIPQVSRLPPTCGTHKQSVVSVGLTSTAMPSSPLAGRAWVDVCVSVENTSTPVVKCRADGTAPVIGTGNAGDPLNKGDCIRYVPPAGRIVRCISDTAATAVTVTECTRTP